MSLVSTDWLEKNLKKVKLIDCSWHLPNSKRDPYKEYIDGHIPNTIFFDLDKNSDQNTDLPHMLPNKNSWEKILSSMGISNEDNIIIYDNSDLISSCRCWYTFIYFGHNPKLVSILNGGLKKWKLENKLISNNTIKINKSSYVAKENKELVKDKNQIDENILFLLVNKIPYINEDISKLIFDFSKESFQTYFKVREELEKLRSKIRNEKVMEGKKKHGEG